MNLCVELDVVMEMIMKATTDPALPANLLTSIRAVNNFFKNSSYHGWLQKHRSDVSLPPLLTLKCYFGKSRFLILLSDASGLLGVDYLCFPL